MRLICRLIVLVLSCLGLAGCDSKEAETPTERDELEALAPPPTRLLALTSSDELALVDAASGAILATSPLGDGGGGSRDVDVVPGGAKALAFVGDSDDPFGELVSFGIGDGALDAPAHVAWFDGDARIAAGEAATLVFERGYANQWKLLRDDGRATSSLPAPPPISLSRSGSALDALAVDAAGALVRGVVRASPSAWPPPSPPSLGRTLDAGESALLVDDHDGSAWLFVLDARGDLEVLGAGQASLGASRSLQTHLRGARLASGRALGHHRFALLLSGADAVVTLRLDARGRPSSMTTLTLPGSVPEDDDFFSRSMERVGADRLLVATRTGLFALDTSADGLIVDDAFSAATLRAPFVVLR